MMRMANEKEQLLKVLKAIMKDIEESDIEDWTGNVYEPRQEIEVLSNDYNWRDYFKTTGEVEVKLNYKKKV